MSERVRWSVAFAFLSGLAALPFLVTYRLPMSDLPQHAAQIAMWRAFSDDCYAFARLYELNFLTPYLIGYSITRLFAGFLTVNAALKLTVWLAVIALPASLVTLTRRTGLDRWIALVGFPLAFGFAFYWGFLNFLVALPLGVLLVAIAHDYAQQPTVSRASWMALLGIVLVASHGIAFALFGGIAAVMQLTRHQSFRSLIRGLVPLGVPAVALVLWVLAARSHQARARLPLVWDVGLQRILDFPTYLLGCAPDAAAAIVVMLLGLCIALSGLRVSRRWQRWVPAACAGGAYLVFPSSLFGQILMFPRFAFPAAALVLLALDRREPVLPIGLVRGLIVSVCATWLIVLSARFHRFDAEARGFDRVVDAMRANQRVLLLNVFPQSDSVPGVPFIHFAGYYQERKGGVNGWSFANNFPSLVRYVEGAPVPRVPPVLTYDPRYFHWSDGRPFDAIVVHSPIDMGALLFGNRRDEIPLRARSGLWWLYARRTSQPAECRALEADSLARRPLLSW